MNINLWKNLWVGIGCKRGSSEELLQWAVVQALASYGLEKATIAGFATIDRKAQEPGLIALAANWNLPLMAIPAKILAQVPVSEPSEQVAKIVGTPSVAEAGAIAAAIISQGYAPELFMGILPKLFPKQIYKLPDQLGMVTVAISHHTAPFRCIEDSDFPAGGGEIADFCPLPIRKGLY
jgi:hypothetical protein